MILIESIKVMGVIDSNVLKRNRGGKLLRAFPHPAPAHASHHAPPPV
jgi:hypothetical protein